jgi:hypothetical protein
VVRCAKRAARGWHGSVRKLGRGGATVRCVCVGARFSGFLTKQEKKKWREGVARGGHATRRKEGGCFDGTWRREGAWRGTNPGAAEAGGALCRNGGGRRGGWPVDRPTGWGPSISETRREGERMASGPGCDSIKFKIIQICPNLIQTKTGALLLQIFLIKYGWKIFEGRNNFYYSNFSRFEMEFELKFRETSMS